MKNHSVNRTVLITGASRGIGAAIAERYRRAGWYIIAPTRSQLDLSKPESLAQWTEQHQCDSIDVLINNAAENIVAPLEEIEEDVWLRMLQINLTAPLQLMKAFGAAMAQRQWGRIVNIGSIAAFVSRAGRTSYAATKGGLLGMMRSVAIELAPHGVLVNMVAPGFIATDLTYQNNTPKVIESMIDSVPMRRLGQPEEVAELVYFLGSEKNTFITGAAVPIDGGYLCQ
ncbi:MAG: SDR family oxidoreductase [Verrucomicrobia bacterium]|nr:SDR family oxidoreductase [Verrucomicrobiota bacterium]